MKIHIVTEIVHGSPCINLYEERVNAVNHINALVKEYADDHDDDGNLKETKASKKIKKQMVKQILDGGFNDGEYGIYFDIQTTFEKRG